MPGTEVPEHSHDEGDGFRYIVSGSIIYNGQELLAAGDWMFIPKGKKIRYHGGRSRGYYVLLLRVLLRLIADGGGWAD